MSSFQCLTSFAKGSHIHLNSLLFLLININNKATKQQQSTQTPEAQGEILRGEKEIDRIPLPPKASLAPRLPFPPSLPFRPPPPPPPFSFRSPRLIFQPSAAPPPPFPPLFSLPRLLIKTDPCCVRATGHLKYGDENENLGCSEMVLANEQRLHSVQNVHFISLMFDESG